MCRPDGRHVLNNQGTDDYVLTRQRLRCNNPTSVWTCVSTTKYRIRQNHPDATKKDHIKEIQQSSGFLAIKVNDNQLKTIEKE